jgi:predicted DCC family thiol-disulfide oxidoreductase YuxK
VVGVDQGCAMCLRWGQRLQRLDRHGRLRLADAAQLPYPEALLSMHAVDGVRVWTGFRAWREVARRLPVLWPLWLVWSLPGMATVGERVYRRIAAARACTTER